MFTQVEVLNFKRVRLLSPFLPKHYVQFKMEDKKKTNKRILTIKTDDRDLLEPLAKRFQNNDDFIF